MRLHGIDVDQRTGAAMLLLELWLVRLQHAYLTPAIEEEHYGAHPQDEYEAHNQHLLGAHNDLGACNRDGSKLISIVLYEMYGEICCLFVVVL